MSSAALLMAALPSPLWVVEKPCLLRLGSGALRVFGEQYTFMVSERGLTAALDRHLELLGENRAN